MRDKVKTFKSENVGALLHEMRFEPGAQRRSGLFFKGAGKSLFEDGWALGWVCLY